MKVKNATDTQGMKRYWLIITLSAAICIVASVAVLRGWESLAVSALHNLRTKIETDKKSEGAEEENQQPIVALTFDDGPIPGCTDTLLEGLRERGVCATFFLLGVNIDGNEELVKKMVAEGHLLGAHTQNHVNLPLLPLDEAMEQVTLTADKIETLTGQEVEYVRPPYGEWNETLEKNIRQIPVGWSVDSRDWALQNTDAVTERVMNEVEDGDIILLHDCYDTSVEAAFRIIDELKERGFRLVTVDQLLDA